MKKQLSIWIRHIYFCQYHAGGLFLVFASLQIVIIGKLSNIYSELPVPCGLFVSSVYFDSLGHIFDLQGEMGKFHFRRTSRRAERSTLFKANMQLLIIVRQVIARGGEVSKVKRMEVLVVFLGIKKAVLVSSSSLIKIMKVSVNVIFLKLVPLSGKRTPSHAHKTTTWYILGLFSKCSASTPILSGFLPPPPRLN